MLMFNDNDSIYSKKLFETAGVILNIKLETIGYEQIKEIKIVFENNKLIIRAEGEGCSDSWFEQIENFYFDELIGKRIISTFDNDDYIKNETNCWSIKTYKNHFVVKDNQFQESEFPFLFINQSEGYYTGFIEHIWEDRSLPKICDMLTSTELIIIVGLPGAGKTNYAKNNYYNSEYIVYDDDKRPLSNIENIIVDFYNGKKVCIIEPIFTDYSKYQDVICKKFLSLLGESRIRTILFSNDEKNSHINNERRLKEFDKKRDGDTRIKYLGMNTITLSKKNDIDRMTKYYSVDNDYINKQIVQTYVSS